MEKSTIYEMLGFVMGFLGIGLAYYAVHFGIRLERTKREMEHKERMRALELGRSLPGDGSWLSPLRAGMVVAAVVPIGVIVTAAFASSSVGYREEIWETSAIVSVCAVICGTMLTGVAFVRQPDKRLGRDRNATKDHVEDDAYDVVSARG